MGHGTPDWREAAPKETTYALGDMAELAARLGSIVTFDRRGDVVFLDSFDSGLSAWTVKSVILASDAYPVVTPTRSPGLAITLVTPADTADFQSIYRVSPLPVLGKIAIECSFTPVDELAYFVLVLAYYAGEHVWDFTVWYDHVLGEISVSAAGGSYPVIGSPGVQRVYGGSLCVFKTVVDLLAIKYNRVLFNEHTYDASAYGPVGTDALDKPSLIVSVQAWAATAANIGVTIDDFILTQNEP
jgi:hypothetical protein